MNKDFVAAYKKAFGSRPGFMAVSGYDGIHLIYEALKKDRRQDRRRCARRSHEGDEVGKPARSDLDRPRKPATHRAEHLYPQGREGRRRTLQTSNFATFEAVKDAGKTKKVKFRGERGRVLSLTPPRHGPGKAVKACADGVNLSAIPGHPRLSLKRLVREDVDGPGQARP